MIGPPTLSQALFWTDWSKFVKSPFWRYILGWSGRKRCDKKSKDKLEIQGNFISSCIVPVWPWSHTMLSMLAHLDTKTFPLYGDSLFLNLQVQRNQADDLTVIWRRGNSIGDLRGRCPLNDGQPISRGAAAVVWGGASSSSSSTPPRDAFSSIHYCYYSYYCH